MAVTVTTPTTIVVRDSASRGPVGPAPTFAIGNVTTGAENSSATISNVGNSSNIVLDISIPRGNTGNVGPQGATGASGVGLPLANGASNIDIPIADGYVTVTANAYTWTFNETNGLLELAGNLANFSACSAIDFVANSSGDGNGYSTIELRPDSNAVNDQYLIIDPTVPNHIHIRAGGQQDNSAGQLYIGGEYSNFSVGSGENPPLFVTANQHTWGFGPDGALAHPLRTYNLLPSPATAGIRAFIIDANVAAAGNFGAVVGGGGSNTIPVWSDGTNWLVG